MSNHFGSTVRLTAALLFPFAALAIEQSPQERESNAMGSATCCHLVGFANACGIDSGAYQEACMANIERQAAGDNALLDRVKVACAGARRDGLKVQAERGYASCANVRAQIAQSLKFQARAKDR